MKSMVFLPRRSPIHRALLIIGTSKYGDRKHPITGLLTFHNGVDCGRDGDDIYPALDGTVFYIHTWNPSSPNDELSGNFVRVLHSDNSVSAYGHMKNFALNLKMGDSVFQDSSIGKVGMTGHRWIDGKKVSSSTAPHCHFTQWGDRTCSYTVDPESVIDFGKG